MIWNKIIDFEAGSVFTFDKATAEYCEVVPIYVEGQEACLSVAKWEPDGIYFAIYKWVGELGKVLRDGVMIDAINFIPAGVGRVDINDYVWNYRLTGIYANVKDRDSGGNPIRQFD